VPSLEALSSAFGRISKQVSPAPILLIAVRITANSQSLGRANVGCGVVSAPKIVQWECDAQWPAKGTHVRQDIHDKTNRIQEQNPQSASALYVPLPPFSKETPPKQHSSPGLRPGESAAFGPQQNPHSARQTLIHPHCFLNRAQVRLCAAKCCRVRECEGARQINRRSCCVNGSPMANSY
jgi:hypothetical protein